MHSYIGCGVRTTTTCGGATGAGGGSAGRATASGAPSFGRCIARTCSCEPFAQGTSPSFT